MQNTKYTPIDEIKKELTDITIRGRILSKSKRETTTQKGPLVYFYGLIGDETGVLPYTAWYLPDTVVEKSSYIIKGAYSKIFKDKVRLYFDRRAVFTLIPDQIEVKREYRKYKIRDISMKDRFVSVEGVVESQDERGYTSKDGEQKKLYRYVIRDNTGWIGITSFNTRLEVGKAYEIEGARVDEFNGYYSLSLFGSSKISEISYNLNEKPGISLISEIENPVGGLRITGFPVSSGDRSGLVTRCPECRKLVDDLRCPDHPEKELELDIYLSFTIDDGSGYIMVNAGFDALKEILEKDDSYLKNREKPPLKRDVSKMLEEKVLSRALEIQGNTRNTTRGIAFRALKILPITESTVKEIQSIQEEEFL